MYKEGHLHLWTTTSDGAVFANTPFESEEDGVVAFLGIVKDVTKHNLSPEAVTLEEVKNSLRDGDGMYCGVPNFLVVISRCDGVHCLSSSWN